MHFARIRPHNVALVIVTLFALLQSMPTQAQSPVSREMLEQMFANIAKKTEWDMTHDMLWGYFFTHRSRPPLEAAAKELSKMGYRIVDIYVSDKDHPSDPDLWWLHVERVETHSVSSLDKRNSELAAYSKKISVDSYDGMDVGPVGGIKK